MMQYRNPQYTSTGAIDCEIKHPKFGWIPFTAKIGTDAFAEIEAAGGVAEYVAPPEPDPAPGPTLEDQRAAASLDRMTFALRAAEAGYVTYDAAAQWAAGNSAPPPLQTEIDALPEEQRGPALVQVLGAANIRRDNELMPMIIKAFETDDAGADALYGITE